MPFLYSIRSVVAGCCLGLLATTAAAQATVPRGADGHPDLEGVWENNVATPLERPRQLANKPTLTDGELAVLIERARRRFTADADAVFGDSFYDLLVADGAPVGLGATGTYSQNWLPDRYFEHRTSLINHPADGRLPPMTAAATARLSAAAARRQQPPASAADFNLPNRCVAFGVPDLFAAYMSVYHIVQTPDYVVIAMEKIHDARVIPLDGRPHVGAAIRQYLGDSRGRWDGDTLVVETTNFHPNGNPMGGLFNRSSANMTLTERFTRTGADTLQYSVTIDDPRTWMRPWTMAFPLQRDNTYGMFEYACHEGNYGLRNALSASRAAEQAAESAHSEDQN